MAVNVFDFKDIMGGADGAPAVVRCSGNDSNLRRIPDNLEVFGSTISAIEIGGELVEIKEDTVVIVSQINSMIVGVLDRATFNAMYGPTE